MNEAGCAHGSALLDCKMQIVELLHNANDEELAECDVNLYNALIEHPDVMERMGVKPHNDQDHGEHKP